MPNFRSLLVAGAAAVTLAGPVAADPREDAEYIAATMFSQDVVDEMFGAIGEMMVPLMMGEMQRNGVTLSEEGSAALSQMMLKAMLRDMGSAVTEMYADIYQESMSADDLAAYRAFLETPAGKGLIAAQPMVLREASRRGEQIGMSAGVSAMASVIVDVDAGRFPKNTSDSAKRELSALFE